MPSNLPINKRVFNFNRINSEETAADSGEVGPATLAFRRATSYCHASAMAMRGASHESSSDVAADLLIGRTASLTGKHRRMLQTRQAYFKYQLSEMSSNASESYKQHRTKETARKLLAQGGPHDRGFFKCFNLYLEEALKQFVPPQNPKSNHSSEEERKF